MDPIMQTGSEHATISTNGIRLHVVEAGPGDGPLVILLHGFPEFWYGWRHQIGPLAEAGFRVLAPDQRGYNTSDKPAAGLRLRARHAGGRRGRADRRGGAADGRGGRATTGAGSSPGGWRSGTPSGWSGWPSSTPRTRSSSAGTCGPRPRQMLGAGTSFFFQLPWLPEAASAGGTGGRWRRRCARPAGRGPSPTPTWSATAGPGRSRGAITAMIHWYRAALAAPAPPPADARVRVPSLLIWGAQDRFLDRGLARPSLELCDDGRLELIEEATHWVQHEEPERVNRLLLDFLRDEAGPSRS